LSHTPNELADMFPESLDKLHNLKVEGGEAAKLFEEYHDLTREIHRAETNVEPTDDFHLDEMRKNRLQMLDRVAIMLK